MGVTIGDAYGEDAEKYAVSNDEEVTDENREEIESEYTSTDVGGNVDTSTEDAPSGADSVSPVFNLPAEGTGPGIPGPGEQIVVTGGVPETVSVEEAEKVVEESESATPENPQPEVTDEERAAAENHEPVEGSDLPDNIVGEGGNETGTTHTTEETPSTGQADAQANVEGGASQEGQYDPTQYGVPEVNKYLATTDEAERERVIEAEKNRDDGTNPRKGITEA